MPPKFVIETSKCPECRGKGEVKKKYPVLKCAVCGETFTQHRKDATCCSKRCAHIAQSRRRRERLKSEESAA